MKGQLITNAAPPVQRRGHRPPVYNFHQLVPGAKLIFPYKAELHEKIMTAAHKFASKRAWEVTVGRSADGKNTEVFRRK